MVLIEIALPLGASCARNNICRRSGFYIIQGGLVLADECDQACVTQWAATPAERTTTRWIVLTASSSTRRLFWRRVRMPTAECRTGEPFPDCPGRAWDEPIRRLAVRRNAGSDRWKRTRSHRDRRSGSRCTRSGVRNSARSSDPRRGVSVPATTSRGARNFPYHSERVSARRMTGLVVLRMSVVHPGIAVRCRSSGSWVPRPRIARE